MPRELMLQRLLALGPSIFSLVAEAIEHLGNQISIPAPLSILIPSACIEQGEAETCVANCFTVTTANPFTFLIPIHATPKQVSIMHWAINADAPSAPRSPAKGRISFARVKQRSISEHLHGMKYRTTLQPFIIDHHPG